MSDFVLHTVEHGSGRPLVFLHGGLADHRSAALTVGALASRCRVITPDLRGGGRSVYAGPLSWDLLADDIAALLDRLGLERAVVGGTSAGSGCALRMALRHPARVAGLILVSPVYAGADHPLAPEAAAAMRQMDGFGQRTLTEGIAALHPLFEALPAPLRERARAMVDSFDPGSVAATTGFLASLVPPFGALAELRALPMPVLLVPGSDPTHPAQVAALLAGAIPHAELAAPSPTWAASPALTDAIARFVDRC
jgi:pimeloyl-ACP methyl ester carboxylesterase